MSEVKWLLVGAGDIAARRVAPALVAVPSSRLMAVCDVRLERASELAAQHDVELCLLNRGILPPFVPAGVKPAQADTDDAEPYLPELLQGMRYDQAL